MGSASKSLPEKVTAIILAVAMGTLVLALIAVVAVKVVTTRQEVLRQADGLAELIAQETTAALVFDNDDMAAEILRGLANHQDVLAGHLWDTDNGLRATFERADALPDDGPGGIYPLALAPIDVEATAELDGEIVGRLSLTVGMGQVWRELRLLVPVAAGVGVVGSLLALGLARVLQRAVTGPIVHLTAVADDLSKGLGYARRAQRTSDDETGRLVDAFNRMLDAVEQRDERLRRYSSELEGMVAARTADLQRALVESEKQRELADAANIAKSQFLATMSHEIRTPLNAVIGISDILDRSALDGEQRRLLTKLSASARTLLMLISDVLDVSKIEAGRLTISNAVFDLVEQVEDAAGLVADMASGRELEVLSFVAADVPRMVWGDAMRVRQIVLNLLSNAVKFTEQGEVVVRVAVGQTSGDRAEIVVAVADTGIGIPADKLEQIFEKFVQADQTDQRRFDGSGLGLAISRELARLMGGTITAESEVGAGSTFVFRAAFAVAADGSRAGQANLADACVLVVDDNATNREIIEHYLRVAGADAALYADPRAALARLLNNGKFDAAIVDGAMPDLDGVSLLRSYAAQTPEADRVPALLLTSGAVGLQDADAFVDAILEKPCRRDELLNALGALVHGDSIAERRRPRTSDTPTFAGLRVLLVEDNAVNQDVANAILHILKCVTVVVDGGALAVDRAAAETFDVILMDCQMPGMDGFEATRAIRAGGGGAAAIPIIAVTANAFDGIRERCLDAGMNDVVQKPFTIDELAAALARWTQPRDDAAVASPDRAACGGGTHHVVGSTQQVFDAKRLESVAALERQGIPGVVDKALEHFDRQTRELLDQLDAAFVAGAVADIGRIAHSLKSSSATVGALRLSLQARSLEEATRNDEALPLAASNLRASFDEAIDAIHAWQRAR